MNSHQTPSFRFLTLTLNGYSFDDFSHYSVNVVSCQWFDFVALQPSVKISSPNENLSTDPNGWKRVNRGVNPPSQGALRRIAVLGKVSDSKPFGPHSDWAARKGNNCLFSLRRILVVPSQIFLPQLSQSHFFDSNSTGHPEPLPWEPQVVTLPVWSRGKQGNNLRLIRSVTPCL